jgi:hypothetical protein
VVVVWVVLVRVLLVGVVPEVVVAVVGVALWE